MAISQADDGHAENIDRLNAEVQNLKAGQEALRNELKEIERLLANRNRPQLTRQTHIADINITLNVANDPQKGSPGARVTVVEFTDYQCPFCGRHLKTAMPQIEKNFVETGMIRYVLRDFPLGFHPLATKAQEAAHCAAEQDRFWEMHEMLFANQKALQPGKLPQYAEAAGVSDIVAFQDCLDGDLYAERARRSIAEGINAGVRGTPAFVLGLSGSEGTTVKGMKLIYGVQSYEVFEKVIKELLATVEVSAN